MISKLQMDAIRLPAFYLQKAWIESTPKPLLNSVYANTFMNQDGPFERLLARKWFSNPGPMENQEDIEDEYSCHQQTRWWRMSLVPVGPIEAQPIDLFGLCIDITDAKLKELALTCAVYEDSLTKVSNRRRFDIDLAKAVTIATMSGQPFSIVVADIDRFKAINDSYGHQMGDAALQSVARCMQAALRRDDNVYRIGGDEFAAIIRTGDALILASVVRRIEQEIYRLPVLPDKNIKVSVGGTTWQDGLTAQKILSQADQCMYLHKRSAA